MAPPAPKGIDPVEIDRILGRLDAAARSIGDGADAPAEPIVVELVVETGDETQRWFVQLDDHGGGAGLGPAPDPTVVVRISDGTFDELRSGGLDVQRAIDAGRLAVRGDLGALARARPAVRALAAALAATED